jgi:hypothetical protein
VDRRSLRHLRGGQMNPVSARVGCALIALVALAGAAAAHDRITTRVTWTADISRIVEARCVTCHSAAGRGPMPLETYEDARPWARAIKEEVLTRRMPKWHAVRGYGDLSNDPSLSPFEIALVVAWVDGGAPKGIAPPGATNDMAAPPVATPVAATDPPGLTLPCGEQPLPEGVLTAVTPVLERGQSAGIAVRQPDGRREIVAWIRDFDPDFPTTYRLRVPVALASGSRLTTEGSGACAVTVTIAPRR